MPDRPLLPPDRREIEGDRLGEDADPEGDQRRVDDTTDAYDALREATRIDDLRRDASRVGISLLATRSEE